MVTYTIRIADWQDDGHFLRMIREAVFINEQQVPVELEWDDSDCRCMHILAFNQRGWPIGTARLLPDGHIGRMAVLKEWRRKGVGSAMLHRILDEAKKQHIQNAVLNAQTVAIGFYKKFGFKVTGEEFLDAGIPHVKMVREIELK
jgi:predicted GNAT family N-acyltransferase